MNQIVAPRDQVVALIIVRHVAPGAIVGGWNRDPYRISLGLLPSGPDPVGEWNVHSQPPEIIISGLMSRKASRKVKKCYEMEMTGFSLDQRLENDSRLIGQFNLCAVRLIDDKRWPWLILIPMRAGAIEIHDLSDQDQQLLTTETAMAARTLQQLTNPEKINTGALGNIVRQLHIHVVARQDGDANWPGPVWGFGTRVPYPANEADEFISRLREKLDVTIL